MQIDVVTYRATHIDPDASVKAVFADGNRLCYGSQDVDAIDSWIEGFVEGLALAGPGYTFCEWSDEDADIVIYGKAPPETFLSEKMEAVL